MSRQTPMRVVAIQSANDTEVLSFGPGTYVGDEPSAMGFPNPKIHLDSGGIVWGYESCWTVTEGGPFSWREVLDEIAYIQDNNKGVQIWRITELEEEVFE